MANKEEFREGVESYRKRILDEISMMNVNIDKFLSSKDPFELRHLIAMYRRALEKISAYISYIEDITEKSIEERGKNPKEDSDRVHNQERDGEDSR